MVLTSQIACLEKARHLCQGVVSLRVAGHSIRHEKILRQKDEKHLPILHSLQKAHIPGLSFHIELHTKYQSSFFP